MIPGQDSLSSVINCPGLLEPACFSNKNAASWENPRRGPVITGHWRPFPSKGRKQVWPRDFTKVPPALGSCPLTCPGPGLVTALVNKARPCSPSCLLRHLPQFHRCLSNTPSNSGNVQLHLTQHPVPKDSGSPGTGFAVC